MSSMKLWANKVLLPNGSARKGVEANQLSLTDESSPLIPIKTRIDDGHHSERVDDFIHKPLPGPGYIRVLVVRPSALLDDPFDCTIEAVFLGRATKRGLQASSGKKRSDYTALSYSWAMQGGDKSLCREITIDGKRLAVGRNLFEALRCLRAGFKPVNRTSRIDSTLLYPWRSSLESSDKDLRIWIDAVCIDQNNIEERSEQVANMAAVYGSARRVVAWVGEGDPTEDAALCVLFHHVARQKRHEYNLENFNPFYESHSAIPPIKGPKKGPNYSHEVSRRLRPCLPRKSIYGPTSSWNIDDTLEALRRFFARPYFRRRWIVQEIAHAQNETFELHCGSFSLAGLAAFYKAMTTIWFSLGRSASIENLALSVHASRLRYLTTFVDYISLEQEALRISDVLGCAVNDSKRDIGELVARCRDLDCADERDRLYSLLSIDPHCDIVPDYGLDIRIASIQLAEYLWCRGHGAKNICSALIHRDFEKERDHLLPSWAPDLRFSYTSTFSDPSHILTTALQPHVNQHCILTCRLRYVTTIHSAPDDCRSLRNFEFQHRDSGRIRKGIFRDSHIDGVQTGDIIFELPSEEFHCIIVLRTHSGQDSPQDIDPYILQRAYWLERLSIEGVLEKKNENSRRPKFLTQETDPNWPRPLVTVRIK